MTEQKTRIFIVDDHPLVVSGIESMLSDSPDTVISGKAGNGEEAWSKITLLQGEIDILIADIEMNGMDGLELCRKVKEQFEGIKVIFLSMHDEAYYVKKALEYEADGYMLKICGKEEFRKGIKALIEKGSYFACEILPLVKKMSSEQNQQNSYPKLSAREHEVLFLILQEMTSKDIAGKLFISKQTVDTHRINIMRKTGSKSIVGLLKYAIQHKLIH